MAVTVSVASGKGGVGKSCLVANLGLLLARAGKRVVLADLDVGGANLHILFGVFHPERSLSGFLSRRYERLEEAMVPVGTRRNLKLLAGTGGTLATANPSYQTKQRLIRHLKQLEADVVLLDIGAGTNFHALDFFLMADHHLVVTTPEPTATLDVYKFIKLAAIRRVLSVFVAKSRIGAELSKRDFSSIREILELTEQSQDEEARQMAEEALNSFRPLLVINRAGTTGARINTAQMRRVLKEYVGSQLEVLGEIPEDEQMPESVRTYLPIAEGAPDSRAARALEEIAGRLEERLVADSAAAATETVEES